MKDMYTAGQLAELAGISSRTVRYYDQKGLLKPIAHSEGGYRLYDTGSLAQLQKIKMLQFAGLTLEEIGRIVTGTDDVNISDILWDRKLMLEQQRNRMNRMIDSLDNVIFACKDIQDESENKKKAFEILKLINMELSYDKMFLMYESYSANQQKWHPWVFEQMHLFPGANVLDMGSGYGLVWIRNWTMIPENAQITVVDKLHTGMDFLERFYEENQKLLRKNVKFIFLRQDLEKDFVFAEKYDRIVANHLWKFIDDEEKLMKKAKQALTVDGLLISTLSSYGLGERVNKLFDVLNLPVDFNDEVIRETRERERIVGNLQSVFSGVKEQAFENKLVGINDAKVIMQYIENKFPGKYEKQAPLWKECTQKLNRYFEECGAIEISNFTSLYQCRKV